MSLSSSEDTIDHGGSELQADHKVYACSCGELLVGSKLLISHLNTCHPQTANVTLSHNTVHTIHPARTVEKRSLIKPKVIPQTQQVSAADGAIYVILDQIPSNISADDTCLPTTYVSDCRQINSTDPSQDLGKSIADVNPTQCLQKGSIYCTQSKHTGGPAIDHTQSFYCTTEHLYETDIAHTEEVLSAEDHTKLLHDSEGDDSQSYTVPTTILKQDEHNERNKQLQPAGDIQCDEPPLPNTQQMDIEVLSSDDQPVCLEVVHQLEVITTAPEQPPVQADIETTDHSGLSDFCTPSTLLCDNHAHRQYL